MAMGGDGAATGGRGSLLPECCGRGSPLGPPRAGEACSAEAEAVGVRWPDGRRLELPVVVRVSGREVVDKATMVVGVEAAVGSFEEEKAVVRVGVRVVFVSGVAGE